ncbi:MAG: hypothetical protein ACREVW_13320, partial [Burkholderiales bacterium]
FSLIQQVLPMFQPKWTARAGAKQLYDAYRQHGVCLDEFEGPKFKRIDHIQQLIGKGLLNSDLRWKAAAVAV